MEVLLRLAAEPGRMVSRRALMRDVWGTVIVTDFALSRCIYLLRRELKFAAGADDSPIETLPKRGYRLVWPVEKPGSSQVGRRGAKRPGLLAAGAAVIALLVALAVWMGFGHPFSSQPEATGSRQENVRVAVLPLQNLSTDPEQERFARGLAAEIMHVLARTPGVTVLGRTSAFDASRENVPRLVLGEQLGADFVLSGSVQGLGANRRALLMLQSVPDGRLLSSRSYLLEPGAPFNIVRAVAAETAERLNFAVAQGSGRGGTTSLEAFEEYLAAHEEGPLAQKRSHLLRAVELDPGYAVAWSALAAIEVMPVWDGETTVDDAWARAGPYVERARQIAPDLPDVYVTLGRFRREFGDSPAAIEMFRKALALDPGHAYARANLGLMLRFSGFYEKALEVHAAAVADDPLDALARVRLGTSYWFIERHADAAREYALAAELDPDNAEIYDSWAGMLALGMGRFDTALFKIDEKIAVEGRASPRSLRFKAAMADTLGLVELAQQTRDMAESGLAEKNGLQVNAAVNWLARGEDSRVRKFANDWPDPTDDDPNLQWLLGVVDLEADRPEAFLRRLQLAYPELGNGEKLHPAQTEAAVLLALAHARNGNDETAAALVAAVLEALPEPLASQHLVAAAAYAISGDPEASLGQLSASPPGWVRIWARLAMRDPRFLSLWESAAFRDLISGHLAELERQRAAYLARTESGLAAAEERP